MNSLISLFQDAATRTPAIILAVAAFVLGAIVMCLVCKICCPCGKKGGKCEAKKPALRKDAKPEPKFEKRHPAPADGSIEIYVGNLSYDLKEETLKSTFEAYGKVNDARIITNKFNGKSKGFGFVHMPVQSEAEAAVKALDGKDLEGRPLKCTMAKNVY